MGHAGGTQGWARICKVCGKEGQNGHIKDHIEMHHITGVSHSCNICGKTYRTRDSVRLHKRHHKAEDVTGEANTEEEKDEANTGSHQEDLTPDDGIKAEHSQDETVTIAEELRLKRFIEFAAEEEAEDTKKLTAIKNQDMVIPDLPNSVAEVGSSPPQEGTVAVTDYTLAADLQDLDERIKSMMEVGRKPIYYGSTKKISRICKICGKEGETGNIKKHIKANHIPGVSLTLTTNICGKARKTWKSLRAHKVHKTGKFPTKNSKKFGGKTTRTKKKPKSESTVTVEPDKDVEEENTTIDESEQEKTSSHHLLCGRGCGSKYRNRAPLQRHEQVCTYGREPSSGEESENIETKGNQTCQSIKVSAANRTTGNEEEEFTKEENIYVDSNIEANDVTCEANTEEENNTEEKDEAKTSSNQEDFIPEGGIKAEPSQDEMVTFAEELQPLIKSY